MFIHPALFSIDISTLTPLLNTVKFTKEWRITKILIDEGPGLKLLCDPCVRFPCITNPTAKQFGYMRGKKHQVNVRQPKKRKLTRMHGNSQMEWVQGLWCTRPAQNIL